MSFCTVKKRIVYVFLTLTVQKIIEQKLD